MIAVIVFLVAAGAVTTPPLPDGKFVLTESDYPEAARRKDIAGHVEYALDVDAQGRPTSCVITSTSWSPILDDATCRLAIKRARFSPARNDRGEAISAGYSDWTRFDLQDQVHLWYSGSEVAVDFNEEGAVVRCSVRSIESGGRGRPMRDSDRCRTEGNEATFAALLGRPTVGLRSASLRTVQASGAKDIVPNATIRRIIAEARFERNQAGKTVRCSMAAPSRFPGQPEGSVDLCAAEALRPTVEPSGEPVAKKRLTIEVVASAR